MSDLRMILNELRKHPKFSFMTVIIDDQEERSRVMGEPSFIDTLEGMDLTPQPEQGDEK